MSKYVSKHQLGGCLEFSVGLEKGPSGKENKFFNSENSHPRILS